MYRLTQSALWSFLFLALLMQNIAACHAHKSIAQTDSIPAGVSNVYDGYRIAITNLVVKKKKSKTLHLNYKIVNTGRENIFHHKNKVPAPPIYIVFDESLKKSELLAYKNDIIRAVLNQDITLRAGESFKGKSLKLRLDPKRKNQDDNKDDFTINVDGNSSKAEDYIDRTFCADLHLDTLIVTKQSDKWATIEYHISNRGKGPAAFKGKTKKEDDDLAIKVYLNRTGNLTKGAIPIGGTFIKDQDLLKPGDVYIGTIKLDITKKTRFSSVLIIQVDPYLSIRECDETNNVKSVPLQ